VHGIALGTGNEPVLRAITVACASVGVAALGWRVLATSPDAHRRRAITLQEWS